MPSAIVNNEESLPYGFAKNADRAIAAFFAKRDPKQAKANQKNSQAGRARRNVIAATPEIDLLREVFQRLQKERRREQGRERQQRRRARLARLARQKALQEQL